MGGAYRLAAVAFLFGMTPQAMAAEAACEITGECVDDTGRQVTATKTDRADLAPVPLLAKHYRPDALFDALDYIYCEYDFSAEGCMLKQYTVAISTATRPLSQCEHDGSAALAMKVESVDKPTAEESAGAQAGHAAAEQPTESYVDEEGC